MPDERPAWMPSMSYTDGPPIPPPTTVEDDEPLDYSKGPHKQPFGDDDEGHQEHDEKE